MFFAASVHRIEEEGASALEAGHGQDERVRTTIVKKTFNEDFVEVTVQTLVMSSPLA